jgi:hypothetical protein
VHASCSRRSRLAFKRRTRERRTLPSQHVDVTRLEHENLCGQMDEVLRMLRRIESELRAQGERIATLEHESAKRSSTA